MFVSLVSEKYGPDGRVPKHALMLREHKFTYSLTYLLTYFL